MYNCLSLLERFHLSVEKKLVLRLLRYTIGLKIHANFSPIDQK